MNLIIVIFQRPSGKYQSQFDIKQISFRILYWKDRISQVFRNVKRIVQFAKYIHGLWTSLAVEWLRLCLPMQETQIWALVKELGSHMRCGTTKALTFLTTCEILSFQYKILNEICLISNWLWYFPEGLWNITKSLFLHLVNERCYNN